MTSYTLPPRWVHLGCNRGLVVALVTALDLFVYWTPIAFHPGSLPCPNGVGAGIGCEESTYYDLVYASIHRDSCPT